jgi:hypothetical protein
VIIYKGHSPSLVRARSQEGLEAIFARALCYTGLIGASCEAKSVTGLTGHHHRSDRWTLTVQVFGGKNLSRTSRLFNPSRRHQGPFSPPLTSSSLLATEIWRDGGGAALLVSFAPRLLRSSMEELIRAAFARLLNPGRCLVLPMPKMDGPARAP